MKRLLCLFISLLIVALSGCAGMEVVSNDLYAIREKGGAHYIDFHNDEYNKTAASLKPEASALAANFISFSSVGEMRSRILSGKFSEDERTKIMTFDKNDRGAVKVCNTSKLYNAVLPDDFVLLGVDWYGETYTFYFDGDNDIGGYISIASQESMNRFAEMRTYEDEYISFRETDAERNGEVIIYKHPLSDITGKIITYSITNNGTSMTIQELYFMHESETVPKHVSFWGSINGTYFTGSVAGFTERPSYEWVTSFGLKPYVETETE